MTIALSNAEKPQMALIKRILHMGNNSKIILQITVLKLTNPKS
jgi:hypothetical protein